jgi:hypothetical protein
MTTHTEDKKPMSRDEQMAFVRSRFPDAYCWKYASLSQVIWCPMLKRRLSGYFHTEDEAWADGVKWIEKREQK